MITAAQSEKTNTVLLDLDTGVLLSGNGAEKYEWDRQGTLWRIRACPPEAAIAAKAQSASCSNCPPFDVNLHQVLRRQHLAWRRCAKEWPTFARSIESGQLFFPGIEPDSYAAWLKAKSALAGLTRYYDAIPPYIRGLVSRFCERQFSLWNCMYHDTDGAFSGLLQSTEFLAWLAAQTIEYDGNASGVRDVLALCRMKRRDILIRLGFPPSESMVQLLAKVDSPESATLKMANLLRRLLKKGTSTQRLLVHLPRINLTVVSIMASPRLVPLITPALLAEVGAAKSEGKKSQLPSLLSSICAMCERLGIPPKPLRSVEQAFQARDSLEAAGIAHGIHMDKYVEFSLPPIIGNGNIEPIRDSLQLCAEGLAQRNCVADYIEAIVQGRFFPYRVFFPQRATLFLERRGNTWAVFECLRRGNAWVSPKTYEAVAAWMASGQDLHALCTTQAHGLCNTAEPAFPAEER